MPNAKAEPPHDCSTGGSQSAVPDGAMTYQFERRIEMTQLETYYMTDQPETCPQCGARTEFDEGEEGKDRLNVPIVAQDHKCLNPICRYEYRTEPPEDEDNLNCPKCQNADVGFNDEVFVEAGRYDEGEQKFEGEFDAKRYECGVCGAEFVLL